MPVKQSRIDLIGQNGNNGEHYIDEQIEECVTLILKLRDAPDEILTEATRRVSTLIGED